MRMKYGDAIQKALMDSMNNDPRVVFFGEDDKHNLYGYTEGLTQQFGAERVRDIPLSEAGVVGLACGAALCGLRPIIDLTTENFLFVAMDQICSIAAKTAYMYGGTYSVPITIFCSAMSMGGNAAQHSDRLHSLFMNIPGLKIVCPSTPQDMYSLLCASVKDDNPVLCIADRLLFWQEAEVDFNQVIKLGTTNIVHEGNDLTVVSVSGCFKYVEEIWMENKNNISMEVLDVRTVVPLDYATILDSVKKTGKLVICDTANRTGSLAGHIASIVAEQGFQYLKAPIGIAACHDIPVPYARKLEENILISKEKILSTIDRTINYIRR